MGQGSGLALTVPAELRRALGWRWRSERAKQKRPGHRLFRRSNRPKARIKNIFL
jgi:hypothetical protein